MVRNAWEVAKGVASRIDDAPVPKIVTFKNPLQPKMKRRLSFFCKDPLQEFARATENQGKKGSLRTILSLKFQ